MQEATRSEEVFFDNADEPLVAGANSKWADTATPPQWTSQVNPDTGSLAYFVPDAADQNESLTMVGTVTLPPGGATLSFYSREETEADFDFAHVDIATSDNQFPQGMSATAYVDKLFTNAGATPSTAERNAAISAYGSGDTAGRAAALKSVADSDSVFGVLYNPSFVLMQYHGYLRRNPDDAPDNNFSGYDFWLAKMNDFSLPGENVRDEAVALARVRRAEMVRAFIESIEYRQRFFGAPGGNQQGAVSGSRETASASGWRGGLAKALPYLFDSAVGRLWLPG